MFNPPTSSCDRLHWSDRLRLFPLLCRLIWAQIAVKRRADVRCHDGAETVPSSAVRSSRLVRYFRRIRNLFAFLRRMHTGNEELLARCCARLRSVAADGAREIVLYGDGLAALLVIECSRLAKVRVVAAAPGGLSVSRVPPSIRQWPGSSLANWSGPIVVAALANSQRHIAHLSALGVPRERLVVLEGAEAGSFGHVARDP